jgi:hypothetical protein
MASRQTDDIRPDTSATLAAEVVGFALIESQVSKWLAVATVATGLEELSVHMHQVARACLLMQIVHILGT